MEDLGLLSEKEVLKIMEYNDCIEYIEGTLLDNFIFYNRRLEKYFLCVEHALNEWSSCYRVYSEDGNGTSIFDKWDKLMEDMACIA